MLTFNTRIQGIPCKCRVNMYEPPKIIDGERKDEIFDFSILDKQGNEDPVLTAKITDADDERLFEEFILETQDEYWNPY